MDKVLGMYEVTTTKYKRYFVMANGYDDAKDKVENRILDDDTGGSILDSDGSLKSGYTLDVVNNIKCIGDDFIR